MASNTPMILSKKSQEGLNQFLKQCYYQFNQHWNIRETMRQTDLQYARENDLTVENQRAKAANKAGDSTRFQNVTIPIVMPQVESAVTYQASVFLTGVPIFGVAAAPQYEDEALQLETKIDDDSIKGGWTREITMAFRDGFKYNALALEVCWGREVTAAIETDIGFSATQGKPKEVLWEGNKVKRLNLYNTFYDTRVPLADMYKKGEFVGYTELYSRVALKKFFAELPDARVDNIVAAFESPQVGINISGDIGSSQAYYIPQINPNSPLQTIFQGSMDWMAWAGIAGADTKIAYHDIYQVTTLYARILPSDFGIKVPSSNTPQVWKFIFVNQIVLVYAERQTNAHGFLPVLFGIPNEDGLDYQTKSLADNVSPIQDITSAISNADIAARRRAISDRVLYDPSRITAEHINNSNPSAKIPVRPAAFGKAVGESVYAFPFRDDQSAVNGQKLQQYSAMANMISGQNPVRQGQFVKGNKTQSEFQDVMQNANGRDQLTAMCLESQIFTPLKEILKINVLQYQGGVSLYSRQAQKIVQIDPVALRKAVLNFKVSDGLTPTDKLMDTDTNIVALQMIGSSPQIGASYNIGPLFSYLMKIKGAHISEFEKSPQQVQYESAMQQYQQMVLQIFKANPAVKQEQLPPMPKPQDYGYDPATTTGMDSSNPPTQVSSNQSSAQSTQAPAGNPTGISNNTDGVTS